MVIPSNIHNSILSFFKETYELTNIEEKMIFNETRKEFEGDITFVLFPFIKLCKVNPQELGEKLGQSLVDSIDFVTSYNIVKGFLNLKFENS
jgi:arginyl-tRNA synthetase